jgi:hypothetical protein
MRTSLKILLIASTIALPLAAFAAEPDTMPKNAVMMQKGMQAESGQMMEGKAMGDMPGKMDAMMKDMQGMMQMMKDPEMKARMQKMHDQMGDMMKNMDMTKCGMMGDNKDMKDMGKDTSPAPDAVDHEAHHPKQ